MELPKPEVVSCFFEKSLEPHLPAMELCWDPKCPALLNVHGTYRTASI